MALIYSAQEAGLETKEILTSLGMQALWSSCIFVRDEPLDAPPISHPLHFRSMRETGQDVFIKAITQATEGALDATRPKKG
jgi:hypothetical protein